MGELPPRSLALPKVLTTQRIEGLAERTSDAPLSSIDVDAYQNSSFGAEARLLGWLARHNLRHGRPNLILPRAHERGTLPSAATTDLAYFVLSRMTADVQQHGVSRARDLFTAQGRVLLATDKVLRTPSSATYFVDHQFPGLPLIDEFLDPPAPEKPKALRRRLRNDLGTLGLTHPSGNDEPPPSTLVTPIRDFISETITNAQRHATNDHTGRPIHGLAFASIKRLIYREESKNFYDNGPLSEYIQALQERIGPQLARLSFAEFTVADSGIGIAYHYAKRVGASITSYQEEVQNLQAAFRLSDNAPLGSWFGVGLYKVLTATQQLNGFLSVRTGRVAASRNYLQPFDDDFLALRIPTQPAGLLGGTAISLLVPWFDMDSPELAFGDD